MTAVLLKSADSCSERHDAVLPLWRRSESESWLRIWFSLFCPSFHVMHHVLELLCPINKERHIGFLEYLTAPLDHGPIIQSPTFSQSKYLKSSPLGLVKRWMEGLTLSLECAGNFSLPCQNGHCYSRNNADFFIFVQFRSAFFCIRCEMHVSLSVLLYAPGVSLCVKCRRCQHRNVLENNRTANSGCGLNSCRTYRCWQRLQLPVRNALNLKKKQKNWEGLKKGQIYSFNLWMLEIFFLG